MQSQVAASSAGMMERRSRGGRSTVDAGSIFSRAVGFCDQLLRDRQQSVAIDNVELSAVGHLDGEALAALLSRALCDLSGVSRRGAVLSLGADGAAIVIQSNHPLEIPGAGLLIDAAVSKAASESRIAIEMFWDQGRGPRVMLSLPSRGARVRINSRS